MIYLSKFNHYAQELDKAFKEAAEQYTILYNNLEDAKFRHNTRRDSLDRVERARAELDLEEAQNNITSQRDVIWGNFESKMKMLRAELAKEVKAASLVNPEAIDNAALELLKTGAMTPEEYAHFADKYDENPTMLRLIGHYAGEASNKATDGKTSVALAGIASACAAGESKAMRAWDDLERTAKYCSGGGYDGGRRSTRDPGYIMAMIKSWDSLTGEKIENF